jgi:trehalose-phosphatase
MSAAEALSAAQAIAVRGAGRHLLLLLDFDGTLCEFDPDPEAVCLTGAMQELLTAIGSRPNATIGIVSGRRLEDVRTRVPLAAVAYYAGLHGLEIEGPRDRFRHPDAARTTDLLRQLADSLSQSVGGIKGAFIENKGLAIAAHFRESSPDHAAVVVHLVTELAQPYVESGDLRLMRGSCMLELLPNIDWHKGSAVDWIRARVAAEHGDAWPVYVGDDITDEDAFRAARRDGIAVSAASRASGADFFLDGPADVEVLLRTLADSVVAVDQQQARQA